MATTIFPDAGTSASARARVEKICSSPIFRRAFFPGLRHGGASSQSPAMKRSPTFLLAVLALAAGAIAWLQYDSAAQLRHSLASLTAEREASKKATEAELARLKLATDSALENVARLRAERDAALARAKAEPAGAAPETKAGAAQIGGEAAGGGMMAGFAKMFSTEEGKKMMRSQMAMGLRMQYGALGKDLHLDPKVADQVLGLLGDRQMAMSEATFGAMKSGALDEAGTKEMTEKSKTLKTEYDEKLKAVLGGEGMTQFHDYERTLGDRMMLSMHEQQFSAAGSPLEATQRDSLLQIMKDERQKTPASAFDAANQGDVSKSLAAIRDEATVEKWNVQEQDYQRRVLEAATRTLNPDQVNALQESFKQQLEMQRFGIKMSKEWFTGAKTAPTETATPAK